ncbi:uncharacterized protein LOC111329602 [Stylophora pistillata]|uniref:uncharacterized protein LOC111329602 n=1 Tax=Stylophora pistillata TaxID=50429 RepID=UPI000C03BD93|nr:uncharacterized protein LOC111329602 [Stylophora pistillata]
MAAAITVESENQTISKREPPEVHVKVLELENLPSLSKPWKDIRNQYQPVDVLLLTVKDCEFLSCLSYLNEGFVKSNPPTLGTVYFGNIGDDEVVKVAVMKCDMGSSTPGGSLVVVPKAVRSLRPKAVFNVGFCASLNEEKAKLGDVVVCSKLITYAFITRTGNRIKERRVKVPLKRDLANLVKNIGDGWKPPLKNSTGQKVELRKDGVFLSDPEVVNNRKRRAELIKRYPEATAIEMEGEGLFVAAHDLNIEWIVIKGVSNLADGKKSETDHWRPFASLMAASLVAHTLKDAYVFESWPHFEDDSDTEGRRMPPSPSFPNPKRIKVAAGYKSTPYGLLGDRTMARTVLSSSSSGDDSDEEIDTLGSRWSSIPFLGPGPKKRKEAAGYTFTPSRYLTTLRELIDDPDEESSTPKKRRSLFSPSDPGPEKSKAKAVNTSQRTAVSSTLKTETPNSGSQTKFLDWMKNLPYAESERCKIGDQGTTWSLKDIEAGACLTFTRDAVSTPLLFDCRLYIPTVSFPPLNKDEKLVSSVIELTCDEQPGIHFSGEGKGEVVIAFSHSAPKLEGYEVVIREVVSTENSYECKDLETRNIWQMSDDFAKLRVPYAEANVTHCGIYAVIYRLKSYIYSTRVSGNEEITYSILEYPEVSVRIPAKNVQRRSKLELTFKVQEIHSKGFDCCEEFAGPVLHITCPQIPHLLKPATITLPVMLKGDKDELTRFSVTDVRVFECPSDDERAGWDEITKQLPNPAVLMNGVVTFQVKHFSRFTVWLTKIPEVRLTKIPQALGSLVPRINRLTRYPSVEAGFFACLCNFAEVSASEALALLRLFCYPVHLEGRVKREACASPGIYHYGSGDSLETLHHGDELRADAWSGCTMNQILKLRFRSDDKFETSTMVELPRECTPHIELKFFLHLQEEQPQRELCGFPIATPHQSRTEDIHPDASNRMGRLLTTDHTRANVTRGESYAKDARPGPSTRGEGRSKRPGKRALTTSEDVSNRMRRSSTTDYTKAKVTRGEFYAEDAQPGTSNQGGRRSTRPRDIAPTTSGGESYAEDAQPGPSNRGGQRSTRPRDTAPTTSRVMAGRPSEDELEELSQELGEKWEELAGRLGYNQAARSNFYANDRCSNRLARSAYSMLLAWKQREGSKATYEVLYNALCHKLVQCNLLAQKFCCE